MNGHPPPRHLEGVGGGSGCVVVVVAVVVSSLFCMIDSSLQGDEGVASVGVPEPPGRPLFLSHELLRGGEGGGLGEV